MQKLTNLIYILVFLFPVISGAQAEKTAFGQKYLILYQGITQDDTLSALPQNAEFRGDFRGIVGVGVSQEYNRLRFTPKKTGLGSLTIHDKKGKKLFEYRIEVRRSSLTRIVREIRALLSDVEGITIKIVNNRVVVDGKVLFAKDLSRIYAVIQQYGGQAASLVEINPIAEKKIAEIIEREINNPDVEVQVMNGKFVLKGIVNNQIERSRAEVLAKTFIPPPVLNQAEAQGAILKRKEKLVINLLTIRPPPSRPQPKAVQVTLHYVELSKDYARSSKFDWSPGISDETEVQFTKDTRGPSGILASIKGVITGLLPKLNWAKAHGFARILESATVQVQSGINAHLESNTTIPYTVVNAQGGVGTEFAPIGLTADMKPTVAGSDQVNLDLKFSISTLTSITDKGPSITKNVVNTNINVRSGQSAAIGGLIRNSTTTDYNKLPTATTNPIISLYASKAFRRNQSQFVVFITPIIKTSASQGSEKIKEKFRLRE